MATSDNLTDAFAGESQANRKYLAFAKKAQAEGLPRLREHGRRRGPGEVPHLRTDRGQVHRGELTQLKTPRTAG